MARHDTVETMARHLVAFVLRRPNWDSALDQLCRSLHADAAHARPRAAMMAVATRAETMLRHIAQGDLVAIGRLYFDLLPGPGHPLTEAVIAALGSPQGALRMLRDAGLAPTLHKDENGVSVLVVEIADAPDLCPATHQAVLAAIGEGDEDAPPIPARLHTLH